MYSTWVKNPELAGVFEIESQQALFQAVIDTIPFSLYAIDKDYRVVVWNRGREAGPFGRPRQRRRRAGRASP